MSLALFDSKTLQVLYNEWNVAYRQWYRIENPDIFSTVYREFIYDMGDFSNRWGKGRLNNYIIAIWNIMKLNLYFKLYTKINYMQQKSKCKTEDLFKH